MLNEFRHPKADYEPGEHGFGPLSVKELRTPQRALQLLLRSLDELADGRRVSDWHPGIHAERHERLERVELEGSLSYLLHRELELGVYPMSHPLARIANRDIRDKEKVAKVARS